MKVILPALTVTRQSATEISGTGQISELGVRVLTDFTVKFSNVNLDGGTVAPGNASVVEIDASDDRLVSDDSWLTVAPIQFGAAALTDPHAFHLPSGVWGIMPGRCVRVFVYIAGTDFGPGAQATVWVTCQGR